MTVHRLAKVGWNVTQLEVVSFDELIAPWPVAARCVMTQRTARTAFPSRGRFFRPWSAGCLLLDWNQEDEEQGRPGNFHPDGCIMSSTSLLERLDALVARSQTSQLVQDC